MIQTFLLKGISFKFDNTDISDGYIQVFRIDDNNKYILHKTTDSRIEFKKIVGGVTNVITLAVQTFSKQQIFNILVTVDDGVGTTLRILKNNDTVQEVINTDKTIIRGNANMYFHDNDGTKQPNCFIQKVMYIPNKSYTTNEATVILKGANTIDTNDSNLNALATQFASAEILDKTKSTTQTVNVLPNNQYQLKTTVSTVITEIYNNIVLKTTTVSADTVFTTQSKTNKIKFDITGSFSTLSFKIKM